MASSRGRKPTAPGEGERRAQRGYTGQYERSAAAIYAALERDDLRGIVVSFVMESQRTQASIDEANASHNAMMARRARDGVICKDQNDLSTCSTSK